MAVGVFAGGNALVAITVFSELIAVGDTVDGMLGEVHAENKIKKKMLGIQARAVIHCLHREKGIRAPSRAPRVGRCLTVSHRCVAGLRGTNGAGSARRGEYR